MLEILDKKCDTLADLLDGISQGDQHYTWNNIRSHRTRLLAKNLLQRWWKPPRARAGKKAWPHGGKAVMQGFAFRCAQQVVEEELENLVPRH